MLEGDLAADIEEPDYRMIRSGDCSFAVCSFG